MKTAYFTLGQCHAHRIANITLDKDIVVKIASENPRKKAEELFGDQFAFEYPECPDLKHFPRGVHEING